MNHALPGPLGESQQWQSPGTDCECASRYCPKNSRPVAVPSISTVFRSSFAIVTLGLALFFQYKVTTLLVVNFFMFAIDFAESSLVSPQGLNPALISVAFSARLEAVPFPENIRFETIPDPGRFVSQAILRVSAVRFPFSVLPASLAPLAASGGSNPPREAFPARAGRAA